MRLVVDASCLIGLARIGRLEMLRRMATEVIVPRAVYEEVVDHGGIGSSAVATGGHFTRGIVRNVEVVSRLRERVGAGEAEAIALAEEVSADAVVLDDAAARRIAEREGRTVVGLLGLVVAAASLLSQPYESVAQPPVDFLDR